MTKAHSSRKGRADHHTPFDLLRRYAAGIDQERCALLFREFAAAFAGRRQLVWSRGLKGAFDITEKTDEQLNREIRETAELVGCIDARDWVLVRNAGLRGHLLELARYGWEHVEELLTALRDGLLDYPTPRARSPPAI